METNTVQMLGDAVKAQIGDIVPFCVAIFTIVLMLVGIIWVWRVTSRSISSAERDDLDSKFGSGGW